MELSGRPAEQKWARLAELFGRETDPNWRRSPSILDQMRGWNSGAEVVDARKPPIPRVVTP
jgi:hypothetical protein